MADSKVLARRFYVRGQVQGVGYRWFARSAANALGLRGYARNLDDGRVEVFAMGSASALDDLAGRLMQGPSQADVRGVDVEQAGPESVSGFTIEH